eukprot:comp10144_c0_seq1/m.4983 comp10144_c0_seq1/g.4983  ORF comp10144_c0_seq1/g.4983 comp10144_c0_seq1/m.4983 type:complete len:215 (-) comp10144_c0_seq1:367-1011(-)
MPKPCDSQSSGGSVCACATDRHAPVSSALNIMMMIALGLGVLIAALMVANVVGVYQIQAQTDSLVDGPASCTGQETRYIMKDVCTQDKYAGLCMDAIGAVEDVVHNATVAQAQDAAVKSIKEHEASLKAANSTVRIWGVNEKDERQRSHQNYSLDGVARAKPAYRYSNDAHYASVDCGGFSITLWKTKDGQAETQMAYCARALGYYRVCAAFKL